MERLDLLHQLQVLLAQAVVGREPRIDSSVNPEGFGYMAERLVCGGPPYRLLRPRLRVAANGTAKFELPQPVPARDMPRGRVRTAMPRRAQQGMQIVLRELDGAIALQMPDHLPKLLLQSQRGLPGQGVKRPQREGESREVYVHAWMDSHALDQVGIGLFHEFAQREEKRDGALCLKPRASIPPPGWLPCMSRRRSAFPQWQGFVVGSSDIR